MTSSSNKLRNIIIGTISFIAILVAAIVFVGYYAVGYTFSSVKEVALSREIREIYAKSDMARDALQKDIEVYIYSIKNKEDTSDIEADIKQHSDTVIQALNQIEKNDLPQNILIQLEQIMPATNLFIDSAKNAQKILKNDISIAEQQSKIVEDNFSSCDVLADKFRDSLNKWVDEMVNKPDVTIKIRYALLTCFFISIILMLGLIILIKKLLINPLNELTISSTILSTGDYSHNFIGEEREDEIGIMVKSLNQSIWKVRDTITQIKQTSELVTNAVNELAIGSSDLSSRTEQQASSLEETAASMEELSTTVKQNSENANNANKLAKDATSMAENGGKTVENTINAMNNIEKSSQKITDIISVIDEIAFQTNLLALNAAVEAARAGEAGRGFAVVASEVRALAGRSSTASKEIKNLIDESTKEVKIGSTMVTESGTRLKEIIESIKKVEGIVAQINNAGLEQTSGINEINAAIMQMDEVTQQNAALVEESTAATQSLANQIKNLNELINYFKID